MHPHRLQCPHCSVVLRIRDRRHVGQRVDCPDCGQPILVLADGPHGLQLREADEQPPVEAPAACHVEPTEAAAKQPSAPKRLARWAGSPAAATGIAWCVAGAAAVLLLLLAFGTGSSDEPPDDALIAAGDKQDAGGDDPRGDNPSPPGKNVGANDLRSRLEQLGRDLTTFVGEHERFPAPAVAAQFSEEQRFSWIAELVADVEPQAGPRPLWDRPWRDPLNDRFVRRTFERLRNPAVDRLTGPDRYPATHFVGIAGVGIDAPRLPADHPRAGIFGVDRRTRVSDVKDGLANTLLVSGVYKNIGAWAGGGRGTLRPLTREPYINGPDGFGTGQKHGMSVLMADGSVRFLSRKTSPVVMRRMAAMADGLPLDANVPGEPGDRPPQSEPRPKERPLADVEQPPAVPAGPPVAAPVPPRVIDVAGLLSQKILTYEHAKPAPLGVVLREVEEMVGVPIRIDRKQLGAAAGQLDKAVTIEKLEETTVGAILQALVEQAGLAFVIENDGIRVEPAEGESPQSGGERGA